MTPIAAPIAISPKNSIGTKTSIAAPAQQQPVAPLAAASLAEVAVPLATATSAVAPSVEVPSVAEELEDDSEKSSTQKQIQQ
jgi:hypothetical protein